MRAILIIVAVGVAAARTAVYKQFAYEQGSYENGGEVGAPPTYKQEEVEYGGVPAYKQGWPGETGKQDAPAYDQGGVVGPHPLNKQGDVLDGSFEQGDPPPVVTPLSSRSALACGSHTLTLGTTYSISSPNYPDVYDSNYDCSYSLTPGAYVGSLNIACSAFNIEAYRCRWDWLKVGGTKFCGRSGPSGPQYGVVAVTFHTDSSYEYSGFLCTITPRAASCRLTIRRIMQKTTTAAGL